MTRGTVYKIIFTIDNGVITVDDLAYVSDTEKEYVFKNGKWVEA